MITTAEILFHSDCLTIEYIEDKDCLFFTWVGCNDADIFAVALQIALDFLKEKQVTRYITDTRELGTMKAAHEKHVAEIFMPGLAETTIKEIFIVVPAHVYNNLIFKRMLRNYKDLATSYFASPDEALAAL